VRGISKYLDSISVLDEIDINQIHPSRFNVRRNLGNLGELIASIAQKGLLQPIIVRPHKGMFEVIAGNRRLEACRKLRLRKIKCMVMDVSDKEAYEIALIENIQRESLDPVEEAMAYKKYVDEYGWGSITELSRKIGRSEEYISHRILLLNLPPTVLEMISWRQLKPAIAQELIWLKDSKKQEELAKIAAYERLTTREVRKLVKKSKEVSIETHSLRNFVHSDDAIRKKVKLLDKAILFFKMALVRLDSLIEEAEAFPELREELLGRRLLIHESIDQLMKVRKRIRKTIT
jgi:ParB family chromosome partitioning protein